MAVQYSDVLLPQPDELDRRLQLPDGDYVCRIVQMFDPGSADHAHEESADFILVLSELPGALPEWSEIPWFTGPERIG
jgi:hypothetical protein